MKYILLFTTFLFAGELEVDGGLTVTEGVTASSFVGHGGGVALLILVVERVCWLWRWYGVVDSGGDVVDLLVKGVAPIC